jgi:hypothetical protein
LFKFFDHLAFLIDRAGVPTLIHDPTLVMAGQKEEILLADLQVVSISGVFTEDRDLSGSFAFDCLVNLHSVPSKVSQDCGARREDITVPMMTASESLNSFLTGNGFVHSPNETAAKRKQTNPVATRFVRLDFVALVFPTMLFLTSGEVEWKLRQSSPGEW